MFIIFIFLGSDGMILLCEYVGYYGGGSGFGGQLWLWNLLSESVDVVLLFNFICGNVCVDDLVCNNGYVVNVIQLYQDYIVGFFFRFSYCLSWCYLGIGEEEVCVFFCEVEVVWKEFVEDDCCCIDVE